MKNEKNSIFYKYFQSYSTLNVGWSRSDFLQIELISINYTSFESTRSEEFKNAFGFALNKFGGEILQEMLFLPRPTTVYVCFYISPPGGARVKPKADLESSGVVRSNDTSFV